MQNNYCSQYNSIILVGICLSNHNTIRPAGILLNRTAMTGYPHHTRDRMPARPPATVWKGQTQQQDPQITVLVATAIQPIDGRGYTHGFTF